VGNWLAWRGVVRLNEYAPHRGFWCPACKTLHVFDERWNFDGKFEAPTFTPSLVTRTGHYVQGMKLQPDGKCGFCERARVRGRPSICGICHLNVTAGQIIYHNDCTHSMRGQKVPMVAKDEDS